MRIAGQLSAIVEKSRLYQRMYDLNRSLEAAQEQLKHDASHDHLTGFWNRGAIMDLLEKEHARARRDGTSLAVLMVDIDHFKRINDEHGHITGDRVLQAVSMRLGKAIRGHEALGRYGGEEFLAVLSPSDTKAATMVAERLRAAVEESSVLGENAVVKTTISVGAAATDGNGNIDAQTLVARADQALYRAKRAGRNRVASATQP